jgi:hypothetical protein
LLLSPRWFYRMRGLYARQELGRLRDRFWKAEITDTSGF